MWSGSLSRPPPHSALSEFSSSVRTTLMPTLAHSSLCRRSQWGLLGNGLELPLGDKALRMHALWLKLMLSHKQTPLSSGEGDVGFRQRAEDCRGCPGSPVRTRASAFLPGSLLSLNIKDLPQF